jgi:hypothetical protein
MCMCEIDCVPKIAAKSFHFVFSLYPNSKHFPLSTNAVCRKLGYIARHEIQCLDPAFLLSLELS